MKRKALILLACLAISFAGIKVEDASANVLELNALPQRIYAANPTSLYLLYAVDRSKIAGLTFEFWPEEIRFLDPKVVQLPVLGGFFGKGKTPNMEKVLAAKPDLVMLSIGNKSQAAGDLEQVLKAANIPIFYTNTEDLEKTAQSLLTFGQVTGQEERAKKLYAYAQESIKRAKEAKKLDKKPRVYYAEGKDGLLTECEGSRHTELITLAGGENVHKCTDTGTYGKHKIDFEKIASYDPDFIFVFDRDFYEKIASDEKFSLLRAVKEKKYYFGPKGPFPWFDRPPSFMRFLGLRWTLSVLRPDEFKLKDAEIDEFYELFLDLKLSEDDKIFIIKPKD